MENNATQTDNTAPAVRLSARQQRLIRLTQLTDKQKNILSSASAGVAGISLGVVAAVLMSSAELDTNNEISPSDPLKNGANTIEVKIYSDAPIAENVDDNMSFSEAFKSARQEVGAGGIFEWRGNTYNTYYKNEWDNMPTEQKANFYASVDSSYQPGEENLENEILQILNDFEEVAGIDDLEDIIILDDDDLLFPEADSISADEIIMELQSDDELIVLDPEIDDPIAGFSMDPFKAENAEDYSFDIDDDFVIYTDEL